MDTKTTVYIAGQSFQISSDEMTEEYLQKIAVSANSRIEDIHMAYPAFDSQRAVAFAIFQLAGEYADLQAKYNALDKTLKEIKKANAQTAAPVKRSYNAQNSQKKAAEAAVPAKD